MEIKKISIIGMGALGVLYGDYFASRLGNQSVEFIADQDRINRYSKDGVYCNGKLCEFNMVTDQNEDKTDLLIFAVKASALKDAIWMVRNKISKDTIILSLLNGISSEEIIGESYGMDNIVHCVAQGMDAVKIGNELKVTQIGRLCIGVTEQTEGKIEKLNALVELLIKSGLPFTLEADIKYRLWSKFMLNVGVNQVAMIYEGTYGTMQRPGEAREMMKAAMREVILLANKEHIKLSEKDLEEYIALVDTMNPAGMPSMRQDGLSHRKSEVDLFAGTVIALANKHGLPTPINQKIYDMVREMESKY